MIGTGDALAALSLSSALVNEDGIPTDITPGGLVSIRDGQLVLGPEAGLQLLTEYPQAEGLIVAADGTLHSSPGWARYRVAP